MVASVPPFQATMVPSSVAKRKRAGLPLSMNPLDVLNTVPVGVPDDPVGSGGDGMPTTSKLIDTGVLFAPGTVYSVDTLAPLSEIQKGLVELSEMPQGLTRWGSVTAATPGKSETRFVCKTFPDSRQRSSRASRQGRARKRAERRPLVVRDMIDLRTGDRAKMELPRQSRRGEERTSMTVGKG